MKLPPEIRLRIYEMLFGGRIIHLVCYEQRPRTKSRLGRWKDNACRLRWWHCVCSCERGEKLSDWSETTIAFYNCSCTKLVYGAAAQQRYELVEQVEKIHTALLQTCRRIYLEAVPILYATNTFCFGEGSSSLSSPSSNVEVLLKFKQMLTPDRFDLITSVEIHYNVGESLDDPKRAGYETLWEMLMAMPNLRNLSVAVMAYHTSIESMTLEEFHRFLRAPLERLREKKKKEQLKKVTFYTSASYAPFLTKDTDVFETYELRAEMPDNLIQLCFTGPPIPSAGRRFRSTILPA